MFDYKVVALSLVLPMGLAASLPALAQENADPATSIFEQLDANGDGALSLEELQAGRGAGFAAADTDGDGTITREEMLARAVEQAEARIDRLFDTVDADGDGALTEAELADAREARQDERRAEFAERIFDRIDTDGDGAISAEEFSEARDRIGERMGRGGLFGHRG